MWDILRAILRLMLFFLLSLLTVIFVGLGNLFLRVWNSRWPVRWKNIVIKKWAYLTSLLIGMKINIKGSPPDPPFFLVSNHLSYIDVIPLWYFLDATFIAKSEIKSWPFFGWATKILGVLFIDRKLKRDVHRLNNLISKTISEEQGVILFPEGTSSKGEQVLAFNAPLLKYPAVNNMPVSFASVSYTSFEKNYPAHLNICWWGEMSFFPHFWNLLKISGFEVDITFGDYRVANTNRKILAEKLHQTVSQKFTPVVQNQKYISADKNIDKQE